MLGPGGAAATVWGGGRRLLAGGLPLAGGRPGALNSRPVRAGVAHLAERDLPKVEVAGSSPVSRSSGTKRCVTSLPLLRRAVLGDLERRVEDPPWPQRLLP